MQKCSQLKREKKYSFHEHWCLGAGNQLNRLTALSKGLSDSFSRTELRNSLQGPCHTMDTSVLREDLENSESNITSTHTPSHCWRPGFCCGTCPKSRDRGDASSHALRKTQQNGAAVWRRGFQEGPSEDYSNHKFFCGRKQKQVLQEHRKPWDATQEDVTMCCTPASKSLPNPGSKLRGHGALTPLWASPQSEEY